MLFLPNFFCAKANQTGEAGQSFFSGDEEHKLCEYVSSPCWITTCVMCVCECQFVSCCVSACTEKVFP